ncbi:MAG: hypothetical protein WBS15_12695, partial [Mycobacterium sp.]
MVVVAWLDVVVVGAALVVVVGVWLVVDEGVPVSDSVDDGGLLVGVPVLDEPGFWFVGATVVLTLGVGVLPDVCRDVIMIPAPTASTASAVPTATTTGRRYQASAAATRDWEARSTLACGRAEGTASSEYSPARSGMIPESSSASDQANAGGLPTSAATPDRVVASAIDPAAVGANA